MPAGSRPHDVAPAADGGVWYTAQGAGELGWLDPATGQTREVAARRGLGAARRDRRPGRRPLDHRRRPERDRPRRPAPRDGRSASRCRPAAGREPQHRGLRPARRASGSPGRAASTAARPGDGRDARLRRARRAGPVRHRDDAGGRRLLRLARRQPHRAGSTSRPAQATVLEPPTRGQGARRVWSDSQGRIWVSEWNAGQLAALRPGARGAGASGSCRAPAPQPYAVYVDERDVVWLSDFGANALVRFDPRDASGSTTLPAARRRARRPPAPRPARRGLGRGVRPRPRSSSPAPAERAPSRLEREQVVDRLAAADHASPRRRARARRPGAARRCSSSSSRACRRRSPGTARMSPRRGSGSSTRSISRSPDSQCLPATA